MKKTLCVVLALSTLPIYADSEADIQAARLAWSNAYFEKQGLPVPDSGVKILPEKEMSSYKEMKEDRIKAKRDIQKFGYIKSTNQSTEQLLNIDITSAHDFKNFGNNFNPENTHLKHSVSELKTAYTPTPVPSSVASEYIGAAPYLTYLKEQGWVGVVQFFKNKDVGNCAFSENNIKLSHGAAIIAKEDVREDVNGKTTTVEVMGNEEAGFTYTVEWFDHDFFRKVECANKTYSSDLTNAVIKIAQSIDNQ